MRNAECGIARSVNSVHGAEAPSAPSFCSAVLVSILGSPV